VGVFVKDPPAKRAPVICPVSKSDKSPIFRFFHTDSHSTVTNALTRALQSVNKRNKNIQCCQLKFFQCSQHKLHSSIFSASIILSTTHIYSGAFGMWMDPCLTIIFGMVYIFLEVLQEKISCSGPSDDVKIY
jgi:hypothetical protein